MGVFDPQEFMKQVVTEASDTKVIPCPIGEWIGLTGEPEFKEIVSNKTGESYLQLTVPISIDQEDVCKLTGRTPTKVRWQSLIERNEAGRIDISKGKNIRLGRLREACGVNVAGRPFSFPDLAGKLVKVRIGHRPDDKDPEVTYDEVNAVTKA